MKPAAYALLLLRHRERSEAEIRLRMKRKGYREQEIEHTVNQLREADLVDDERFTKLVVAHGQAKGWFPARIRRELECRGVKGNGAGRVIRETFDRDEAYQRLLSLAGAKWESSGRLESRVRRRRLRAFLARRGADSGTIGSILKELSG